MHTILITGCSSGYGLETARHFLKNGWDVIATMRTPRRDILPLTGALWILHLDVTSEDSIAEAVQVAGPIDALVNNAGIGVVGAFEATPMSYIRKVFDTNTLGVLAMVQAVLPKMRERRSGVIINVTSSVTLAPMHLAAAYTASKQAIEGFAGSLAHELAYFNIRAKLVEPGYAPAKRFAQNASVRIHDLIPEAYADFAAPIFAGFAQPAMATKETDVAEAVWAAVHDTAGQLHFPAGPDAVSLAHAA
jgi:NAD(P)-dependent dehydrogenase (short-subunit alcohol dehydrogenase family)